jgi:hypothetical protein
LRGTIVFDIKQNEKLKQIVEDDYQDSVTLNLRLSSCFLPLKMTQISARLAERRWRRGQTSLERMLIEYRQVKGVKC